MPLQAQNVGNLDAGEDATAKDGKDHDDDDDDGAGANAAGIVHWFPF